MNTKTFLGTFHLKSSNIQLYVSILIGWFLCGKLWFHNNEALSQGVDLPRTVCLPCRDKICPDCEAEKEAAFRHARNINVESSYFRKYLYKPQSSMEDIVSRWKYETPKHVFEMVNLEPRIGINGMWSQERTQIEKSSLNYVKSHHNFDKNQVKFCGMLRRTDPFFGTIYHVKLERTDSNSDTEKSNVLLQIQRGFNSNKPKLVEISTIEDRELITVISPISKVSDRFQLFLTRFEEMILANSVDGTGNVKLLLVIFTSDTADDSTRELLNVISNFKKKNPHALIEYTFTSELFNRALGLHLGVQRCKNDDLMLFIDVDLNISNEFFNRIRRNTIQNKSVMFPVTFSQYDPMIIGKAVDAGAVPSKVLQNKMSINEHSGFWIHYAFGITAMYRSDYEKVGGFKLDISGWGGEDVDLYKKFVADKEIEVFAAVEPDLIHVYHSRGCSPTLAHDQYVMCVGAWAETLGSQIEVANLYLLAERALGIQ